MKKYFILTVLFICVVALLGFFFFQDTEKKPVSIVVIGAGPAGLAVAIEAKNQGAKVTLIEKRKDYVRNQVLFMDDTSIKLLDKWKVPIPSMMTESIDNGEKIGFVRIKSLEEALDYRTKLMGIKKVQGEFVDFQKDGKQVIQIRTKSNECTDIEYDILVAADGSHSVVRDKLGIGVDVQGVAEAFWAKIPTENQTVALSAPFFIDGLFVRRIQTPVVSIVFVQGPKGKVTLKKEEFEKLVNGCGYLKEAEAIANDQAVIVDIVEVKIQQAKKFSDEKKSAILVGDAAAEASFFQGKGANTAFKTAECAGRFFQMVQEKNKVAYSTFNQEMKEITDVMIEDSRFLFQEEKSAWSESN